MLIKHLTKIFAAAILVLQFSAVNAEQAAPNSLSQVIAQTTPGKTHTLNLANPAHKQLVLDSLAQGGKTPENSPQLFKALNHTIARQKQKTANLGAAALAPIAVMASPSAAPQDLNTIIDFEENNTSTNSYTATAMQSVVGGTLVSIITVNITSPDGKTVYGTTTQSQHAQGTEFMVTATAANVPSGVTPIANAVFTYVPETSVTAADPDGTSEQKTASTTLMQLANLGCMTAPNYCTAWSSPNVCSAYSNVCTNTGASSLRSIMVCFQRGPGSGTQCDYYNPSATVPASNFIIPSSGTATFNIPILTPLTGNWTAQVIDTTSGGTCVFSQNSALDNNWSVSPSSPNVLQWNINPLSMASPNACLNNTAGRTLDFFLSGNVKLTGTGNAQGTFQFTSSNAPIGRGNYIVPKLDFFDSCVAQGTLIAMADGGVKPIEEITTDHGDVVLSEHNVAKTVQGTSHGTEMFPMFEIVTDKGQTALLTRTHPVATPKGFVMARYLKTGDWVETVKGVAKIRSIAQISYKGAVYNLALGTKEDAASGKSTFYANGILVGDSRTQQHGEGLEIEAMKRDPATVCKRLPAAWLKDAGCTD